MPGIGVISNRNARLNRLHPELKDQLAYVIGSNGEVSSTKSVDDAYKAVETFRKIGIDMIAISGGDGTAHRTMEIILDVYGSHPLPPILLLPTGTQNMVPRSFGIEGSGLANLMLATMRYRHNVPMRCIRRNLLKVNGHTSFMFGVGIAARFMAEYYRIGDTTPKGAAKLLSQAAASAASGGELSNRLTKKISAQLTIDEDPQALIFHTFFCSFIERLPLHFVLFPRSGWTKDVFELAYSDVHPLKIVSNFPSIIRASVSPLKGITRKLARKVTLDLEEPEGFTLDGELYDPVSHFEIEAGPEINFVVPGLGLHAEDENLRYAQSGPWSMRFLI